MAQLAAQEEQPFLPGAGEGDHTHGVMSGDVFMVRASTPKVKVGVERCLQHPVPFALWERVYPCSIRTHQSTWDKSTLNIKRYLKLIEIK